MELGSGGFVEMTFNSCLLIAQQQKSPVQQKGWCRRRRRCCEVIPMLPIASNTLERTSCISDFLTKICFPQRPQTELQARYLPVAQCTWTGTSQLKAKRPSPGERGWSRAGSSLCRFSVVSALRRKRLLMPRRGTDGFYFGTSPRDCG